MDDDALYSQTLDKIVRKLRGKYGFKRFLRDGYRTANEDKNRRYYKPAEMKVGPVVTAKDAKIFRYGEIGLLCTVLGTLL